MEFSRLQESDRATALRLQESDRTQIQLKKGGAEGYKKGQNTVICSNMHGPRDYHTE